MEGINPTLTFLVMVLGLSGNARDGADESAAAIEREAGCAVPIIVGAPAKEEVWADAFWDGGASDPVLPGVSEQKWADLTVSGTEMSEPAGPLASLDQGADSIMRRTVPTGANVLAVRDEPDPCMPHR